MRGIATFMQKCGIRLENMIYNRQMTKGEEGMKDYTHELSAWLAGKCAEGHTREQILLITYGIEIILNNVLKYLLLFLTALFLHRGKEALVMLAVFAVLRRQLGGIHCRTDTGCFLAMIVWMFFSLTCADVVRWNYFLTAAAMICGGLAVWKKKSRAGALTIFLLWILTLVLDPGWQALIGIPVIGESITILPEGSMKKNEECKESSSGKTDSSGTERGL